MRKPLKVGLISVAVLAVLGGLLVSSMLRAGFSTHDEPSSVEAFAARTMRHWATPSDLRSVRNPLAPSSAILAEGRAHWADHCASCHGNDGSGDTTIGGALYPRAPDMRLPATQDLTDGELFYIIENGVKLTGMPAWGTGSQEGEQESWHLVNFIRHLPQVTDEELTEMAELNPRGLADWQTLEEERRLVQKVTDESLIIGCYVGLLGETGLRKSEGLKLKWDYVDILIGDTNGSKSDVLVNC